MGCGTCRHQYATTTGFKCDFAPWEHATAKQVEVSLWLAAFARDAERDDGCPGYEDFELVATKTTTAKTTTATSNSKELP